MKFSYVYIITNKNRTVFYIGVTSDLSKRLLEHRMGKGSRFCKKYNVFILIYYELFDDVNAAIHREKQIKNRDRDWKIELIRKKNPGMEDLNFG